MSIKILKKNILFVFFALLYTTLQAQVPKIQASLSSYKALIGNQVTLQINVEHAKATPIQFPSNIATNIDSLEVINKKIILDTTINGTNISQLLLVVTAFDARKYTIPEQVITYNNNNQKGEVRTQALLLEYNEPEIAPASSGSNLNDTSKEQVNIKPIKTPIDEPFTWKELLPYLLYIAILLVGLLFAYYLYKFFKKPIASKQSQYVAPPRPAHEIALERLKELDAAKVWQKGDVKQYYSQISEIIRQYLENRYKILALESTTDEIMSEEEIEQLPKNLRANLSLVLELADLVKFAKVQPSIENHPLVLLQCLEIVRSTMQKEELVSGDKK